MLFNSHEFIFLFLPVTLLIYFMLAKYRLTKLATASLVVSSLVFYSCWDIQYLPLLLGSIGFNYLVGSLLEKTHDKLLLALGITANFLLLGYFKYTAFFISSINTGFGSALFVPEIVLPLGISFFTFTQTAYLVDAYRGETKGYSLLTYSLFVTVFPHLIAGPILYHKDMIPQFSRVRNFVFSQKNMMLGISMFSMGLCKKVLIADTFSPWVKVVFANASQVSFVEAWAGALAYTLQIYYDFSGYSEMALGIGLMFNFSLPVNFNSPYKATSIIDFWRRWHMTLSGFLKNYLYIPLGGNRHGEIKRMRNLIITMLLGGLWHGAGWTFVIWGGLHGCYLAVNHLWRKTGHSLPMLLAWLLTFTGVVIAWIFFRADTIADALYILKAMLGGNGVTLSIADLPYLVSGTTQLVVLGVVLLLTSTVENSQNILRIMKPSLWWVFVMAALFLVSCMHLNNVTEFIYFQF